MVSCVRFCYGGIMSSVQNTNRADPVILFDGVCTLCSAWCRFVIRYDRKCRLKLAAIQSDVGQSLLKHYNLPTDSLSTIYFIKDGTVYRKSTAIIHIAQYLSWPAKLLFYTRWLPGQFRDLIYDWVARNRYRWFGRNTHCMLPTPEIKDRFL